MKNITVQLETLTCPSCSQKITKAVTALEGVDKDSVQVLFNSSKVKLAYDDSAISQNQIEATISKMGFEILGSKA